MIVDSGRKQNTFPTPLLLLAFAEPILMLLRIAMAVLSSTLISFTVALAMHYCRNGTPGPKMFWLRNAIERWNSETFGWIKKRQSGVFVVKRTKIIEKCFLLIKQSPFIWGLFFALFWNFNINWKNYNKLFVKILLCYRN